MYDNLLSVVTCPGGDAARHASFSPQGVHSVPRRLKECDGARVGQDLDHEQKGMVASSVMCYSAKLATALSSHPVESAQCTAFALVLLALLSCDMADCQGRTKTCH